MRKLDALFFRKLTALAIDWISTPLPHARLRRRRGDMSLCARSCSDGDICFAPNDATG